MGDAADDIHDAAMSEHERQKDIHASLKKDCPKIPDRPCNWHREEDFGLLECLTCGNLIDE